METTQTISRTVISVHGSVLTVSELGLGSVLHAFHVPLAGTLLSLNQIFLLTRAMALSPEIGRTFAPFMISASSALMKCLAPVGKRLTPMLAISMQGLLYNLGIILLGNNLFGRMVGGILASLWGFIQPLLLYSFLFGPSLFQLPERFPWLEGVFWGLVVGKLAASIGIVLFAPQLPACRFELYIKRLSQIAPNTKDSGPLRDLCKPLFLFSIILTAVFFYFSEGISSALLWGVLRPLALGYLCFYLMRILPIYGK